MNSGLVVSDIMTEDVVYFGEEDESDLAKFCKIRSIDYLPLREGFKVMRFDGNGFSEKEISTDMILSPNENIFDEIIIECFLENSGVKFVTSGGKVVGVVHFSDYNSKEVYTELYSVFHEVEQNLRRILEQEEMLEKELGNENINPNNQALPLSTSGFRKLIEKVDSKEEISLNFKQDEEIDGKYQIVVLRNRVMHSKEMVLMQDGSKDKLNFSKKSFERFIERLEEAYNVKKDLDEKVDRIPEHIVLDYIRRN